MAAQSKQTTQSESSSLSPATIKLPEAFAPLFQPARYKAFYGGRGSAKSHSFAAALIIQAAQRPLRVVCCREIQRSIKDSVKRLLDDKIEQLGLRDFYHSTDTEIRGQNGSLFVFAGLRTNPDTLKSMEAVDIAWVEEAHSVSERSLNILVPTVRQPGSEIWLSWNPTNENDPVDVRFRDQPPPNSIVREVSYADNPWFPDVLREEMEWDRRRDPDKYAHIWLGEYQKRSEARVFHNWRVESFETPADARFYFGADWGFANDPTVLIRCFVNGRTLYVDAESHKVGLEIDHTPARWREDIPGCERWPITADSARPETISYMQRQGFRVKPAKKGQGSLEDGVEFLKSFDIVVHPDCKHTADELSLYSYKVDQQTDEVLPQLDDKHNHVIDALRYAVESMRRGGKLQTSRIKGLM
jgi:phage terminase large subunit